MASHAFFIADHRVIHLANPCGAGIQYRAQAQVLPAGERGAVQWHETAETVVVVTAGVVEVMIEGATIMVAAEDFLRIPAGRHFAWRNAGESVAKLLVRTAPPCIHQAAQRITIHIAAA